MAGAKPLVTCQCRRWPAEGPCKRDATAAGFLCDGCRPGTYGLAHGCSRIQFGDQRPTGHWVYMRWEDLHLPIEAAHGWEPKEVRP